MPSITLISRPAAWVAVVCLGLLCSTLPAANVVRGPYLQNGTPTSVTLCWRTDVATDSRVRTGTVQGTLPTQTNSAASVTDHEITVTGLSPGTKYFYSVGSSSAVLAGDTVNHWFYTLPAGGAAAPVRIWAIGDAGTGTAQQAQVRDAYDGYAGIRPTNVWLMLGDNAYNTGTDAEYQTNVFNVYANEMRNMILWPTRGNHDQSSSVYYGIFAMPTSAQAGGLASGSEAYYAFNYGRVHCVCLDTEGTSYASGSAMLTWLANDLAANTMDWTIAYWHHPPYTKGSHDSDVESDLMTIRANILPVLEAGGVDLVLCGHSHSYERSFFIDSHYGLSSTFTGALKVQAGDGRVGGNGAYTKSTLGSSSHAGTVYAVAGSSGKTESGPLNHPAMYISLLQLGSLAIDVYGNHLDAVFLDNTGAQLDNFRLMKGASGIDTTNPVVVVTAAGSTTQIDIAFSENLDSTSATTTANYTLTGLAGPLTVSGATLLANGKTVRLTVAAMAAGANYTLAIANVKDLANNSVSGGTTAVIKAPGAAGAAPTVTTPPGNQTVAFGATASFTVTAAGPAPLTYQWQKNGANLGGATGTTYTTPATVAGDNGALFRVVVTNPYGSVTSTAATLTVTGAPPPPAPTAGGKKGACAVSATTNGSIVLVLLTVGLLGCGSRWLGRREAGFSRP